MIKKTNLKYRIRLWFAKLGLVAPLGRKPFHVGWMAPGKSLEDLMLYLHSEWGFGRNDKKLKDSHLVLNWSKLTTDHKKYNLQVYNDGEIRGCVENIPITGVLEKPSEMGEKDAKFDLINFLGEFVIEKKVISSHVASPRKIEPDPEIILD